MSAFEETPVEKAFKDELVLDEQEDEQLETIQQNDKSSEQEVTSQETESESEQTTDIIKLQSSDLIKTQEFSWGKLIGSLGINLILPFINGLMLGFGEIIAHEIGFKYNWTGARIYRPATLQKEQKSKWL